MRVDNRDMRAEDPKKSAYNAFMSSLTQMPEPEDDEKPGAGLSGLDLIAALVDGTVELSDGDVEPTGDSKSNVGGKSELGAEASSRKVIETEPSDDEEEPSIPMSGKMPEVVDNESQPDPVVAVEFSHEQGIELGELTDILAGYANELSSNEIEGEELADIALYGMDDDEREPDERFHYPDASIRRSHTLPMPSPEEMGGFFSSYVEMEEDPELMRAREEESQFDPTNPFGFILNQQETPPHKEEERPSSAGADPSSLMQPDDDGLGLPGARDRNYFTPEETPHVAFKVAGPYSDDGIATMEMVPSSAGIAGYAVERLVQAKVLKVTGASLFGTLVKDKTICSVEWDAYKGVMEASTAVAHGVGALSEIAFANFGKEVWDRVERRGEEERRYIEVLEMGEDEDFTCMIPQMKVVNAVLDVEYLNKLWTLSLGRVGGDVELSWDEFDDDRGHRALVKRASALFSSAFFPFVLRAGQDGAGKAAKKNAAQKLGKRVRNRMEKDLMTPFAIDNQGRVRTIQR